MRGGYFNLLGNIGLPQASSPPEMYHWVGSDGNIYKLDTNLNLLDTKTTTDGYIQGIYVDPTDNIYVAHYQSGKLKKYDNQFSEIWSVIPFGVDTTIFMEGYDNYGIYITTHVNGVVKQYDLSGNQLWVDGIYPDYRCTHVDASDNFYLSFNTDTFKGYIRKYDQSRNILWTKRHFNDSLYDIKTDYAGNVFACSLEDTVRKMDSSGNLLWTKDYGSNVYSIDIDSEGNIYVATYDNKIRKIYGTNGNTDWEINPSLWYSVRIEVDSQDNLLVCTTDGNVFKYDKNKNFLNSFVTGTATTVSASYSRMI